MFETIEKGLTLSKAIKGVSKSLNVINELIPIYKEFKPTVTNVKRIISNISNKSTISKKSEIKKTTNEQTPVVISNKPNFFY